MAIKIQQINGSDGLPLPCGSKVYTTAQNAAALATKADL